MPCLLHLVILILLGCCIALAGGCDAARDTSTPLQVSSDATAGTVDEQLAALDTPPGADGAVMALLKRELLRQLETQSALRKVSKVATTAENRVTSLAQSRSGGQVTLAWVEKAVGDYNQDGTVGAADLAPVGIYWMHTAADTIWTEAQAADGDGNGIINISDVTPLGRNFGNQLTAYDVYSGATAEFASCSWIGSIGRTSAVKVGSERRYSIAFSEATTGACFFVAPSDGADTGIESLPSNLWGTPNWAHTAHFPAFCYTAEIAYDPLRHVYYVIGNYNSDTSDINSYLAKYSQQGELIWARAWSTPKMDYSCGVAVDPAGNIFESGYSRGIDAGTSTSTLVKWDSAGNVLWSRGWSGQGLCDTYGMDVAVDANGLAYVNATLKTGMNCSMVLLGYTAEGAIWNTVTWGGGAYDFAGGMALDGGNVYCCGGTDRGPTPGVYAPFVVCYSASMTRQWGKFYNTQLTCSGREVVPDPTGICLSAEIDGSLSDKSDAVLIRLDSNGNLQWNSCLGGTEYEFINDLAIDGSGNIFLCGSTQSLNFPVKDAVLIKYDSAGNYIWTAIWQAESDSEFTGMVFDTAGMLVLSGTVVSLSHTWGLLGMPTWQQEFTPVDITDPDVPVTGIETDLSAQATAAELTGEIDQDTPGKSSLAIISYKPF